MYCIWSKKEDIPPKEIKDYIMFDANESTIVVVKNNDIVVSDNWVRIPLFLCESLMNRDGTEWVEPSSATLGRQEYDKIKKSWFQSFVG